MPQIIIYRSIYANSLHARAYTRSKVEYILKILILILMILFSTFALNKPLQRYANMEKIIEHIITTNSFTWDKPLYVICSLDQSFLWGKPVFGGFFESWTPELARIVTSWTLIIAKNEP